MSRQRLVGATVLASSAVHTRPLHTPFGAVFSLSERSVECL
jgi:hypothetical protein